MSSITKPWLASDSLLHSAKRAWMFTGNHVPAMSELSSSKTAASKAKKRFLFHYSRKSHDHHQKKKKSVPQYELMAGIVIDRSAKGPGRSRERENGRVRSSIAVKLFLFSLDCPVRLIDV